MTTIAEVRSQYPQYKDLSDEQLGEALHAKYYSDIPFAKFAADAGIKVAKPEATAAERTQAAISGVDRGIAGLIGLPVDTVENLINLAKAGFGTAATAAGRPDLAPELTRGSFGGSESISGLMNKAGISTTNPRPDDQASRVLNTAGTIVGGSMLPGSSVKGTIAAALGGSAASEVLGPQWTGVGAMAPAAVAQGAASVRNAIAARVAPAIETFKQAGTMPSVGQATYNVFLHGLENLAAKFPGGAGIMKRFIEAQQRQMGDAARTGTPTEAAGRAIEKGITGDGGFLDRTRATWQKLDQDMANKIGGPYNVPPVNTMKALDDLVQAVPGAERTTSALVNKNIANIREQFRADTVNNLGGMPFEAMRNLRSRVGSMLDDALVSDIPTGELKKVYAALSKDIEAGARAVGAGKEFDRQSNYYRARMDRVESVLDRVIGKGRQPEEIFKAFSPTDPDQANKARAVLRSLAPEERKIVSEAVVNRLGRATPGKQDEFGEKFSSETFLTNWNKLSPGAKAQIFPDPPLRDSVEKIAKAAANIRAGSGIYANPSGTAGSFAAYSVYTAPFVALGHVAGGTPGALTVAASAGLAAGAANIGAKMLTNPKVVEWLATPVNPGSTQAAAHLARLGIIYSQTKDDALKGELAQYINSVQQGK